VAARDLLTKEEGKAALRISPGDDEDDELLDLYITAASEVLDEQIGPTVVRSVTSETHSGLNRSQTGYRSVIVLRWRPVYSISAVTVDGVALTQTTDYRAEPYSPQAGLFSGMLHRSYGGALGTWGFGMGNVVCSYSAGRVLSTSQVPTRIKRSCGLVLENLWRDREAGVEDLGGEFTVPRQSFPTFAMPRAAAQLLTREMGFAETFGIGGG